MGVCVISERHAQALLVLYLDRPHLLHHVVVSDGLYVYIYMYQPILPFSVVVNVHIYMYIVYHQ